MGAKVGGEKGVDRFARWGLFGRKGGGGKGGEGKKGKKKKKGNTDNGTFFWGGGAPPLPYFAVSIFLGA